MLADAAREGALGDRSVSAISWATAPIPSACVETRRRARGRRRGGQSRARRPRAPRSRLVQPARARGDALDARRPRRGPPGLPRGAAAPRGDRGGDAGARESPASRGVGLSRLGGGRVRGLRRLRHAALLRRSLALAGRVVARLERARATSRVWRGDAARVRLEDGRRYIINVGSVGQPRDRDPRAAYACGTGTSGRSPSGASTTTCAGPPRRSCAAGLPRRAGRSARPWGLTASRCSSAPGCASASSSPRACSARWPFPAPTGGSSPGSGSSPALCCGLARSPRGALADGWLAGTVFFVVLLRWLDHTFLHFSAIPWPLTWLPIAALAAYCGLYAGADRGGRGLAPADGSAPGGALGLVPALWVAGEWMRGHLMGGFPWGLLGYSQHAILPVIQIAELAGVYGVSFLIAARERGAGGAGRPGLAARLRPASPSPACSSSGSLGFGWTALRREDAGRGGGGPASWPSSSRRSSRRIKWDPAHHAEILDIYERLTREAARVAARRHRLAGDGDDDLPPRRSRAARSAHPALRRARHAAPDRLHRPGGRPAPASS